MKTKPKFKIIRISAEVHEAIATFARIAGVADSIDDMAEEYLAHLLADTLDATEPWMMGGICGQLLESYVYDSEAEKDRVEAELWAEVCRRKPRAEIIPFPNLAPRMVV